MNSLFSLQDKVALVSGGYGYLGSAISVALAQAGAETYVLGRSEAKFREAFGQDKLPNLYFQQADISSTESIAEAFKYIHARHNRLDVLVNNAYYSAGQDPEQLTDEQWALGIDGNLNSVYRCIREAIPYMKQQESGKIINVSSMYGMVSPDFSIYDESPASLNPPHYGAAKAGVLQLTRYFACYLGKYGIHVNTVTPGPFPNEEVQQDEGFIERLKKKTALNRIGSPADLKGAFVYLASDASAYMTGQNLVLDGGWTAW
ncbi:SDR family NAD(P)-dependent oxidoreductase [Pontibacter sp. 172403-2]|uniref:SDR family NAD(P)-dependent oxidoreductase n=1 Tax=Pontibacter rufus TaxID=2791028 RepID=UPI001E2E676F|nr:SDR family oxidoreductase [Pontibacter sp. 172403-2]